MPVICPTCQMFLKRLFWYRTAYSQRRAGRRVKGLRISASTGWSNRRPMTSSAPPDRGLSKSRRPVSRRGPQNSSDDEGMPVICPTCQIRLKYSLPIPQAMNDPSIRQRVQDIFDRSRFPGSAVRRAHASGQREMWKTPGTGKKARRCTIRTRPAVKT
jgi:hypothetical protein